MVSQKGQTAPKGTQILDQFPDVVSSELLQGSVCGRWVSLWTELLLYWLNKKRTCQLRAVLWASQDFTSA